MRLVCCDFKTPILLTGFFWWFCFVCLCDSVDCLLKAVCYGIMLNS